MSSVVVSTSAALSRLFVFDAEETDSAVVAKLRPGSTASHRYLGTAANMPGTAVADPRLARVMPASQLDVRPAPQMVSTGIPAIDALTGGLPRGCLTEICGSASSGRTTLLLSALAAATGRGEFCVVVDAGDALDPQSVAAAGVQLEKLLWVRCGESPSGSPQSHPSAMLRAGADTEKIKSYKNRGLNPGRNESYQTEQRLEQVLRATDLLLESGGFGLIVLDLAGLPPQAARYIPLTTWFRFRRTVEHTPTVLLAIEQQPIAGSCSSLLHGIEIGGTWAGTKPILHSRFSQSPIAAGMDISAELLRSRWNASLPARSPLLSPAKPPG